MSTPLLTMCCTHPGEVLAAGWITLDGRPRGIADWSWSSPSRIHRDPNPMRRIRRAAGSGAWNRCVEGNESLPCSFSLRYWTVRTTLKPMAQRAPTKRMMSNWWKRAVWNVETMRELPV